MVILDLLCGGHLALKSDFCRIIKSGFYNQKQEALFLKIETQSSLNVNTNVKSAY